MREIIIGTAKTGLFEPLWSARIFEEWARAVARKFGPEAEVQTRGEAAMLHARWPKSSIEWRPSLEARLWLPDPADTHVLAAAIAGSADVIVTMNAKDFPRNILTEEGVSRVDPDGFLFGIWQANGPTVEMVVAQVLAEARRLSGDEWSARGLLKKARLPRLAKAVAAQLDEI